MIRLIFIACFSLLFSSCSVFKSDDSGSNSRKKEDLSLKIGGDDGAKKNEIAKAEEENSKNGSASGVANAGKDTSLISGTILKLHLTGEYVGVRSQVLYNFNVAGKVLAPVQADIEDDGIKITEPLPSATQVVINLTDDLFVLLRYPPKSADYYLKLLGTTDAYLIRKSDGRAWKFSDDFVNPASFEVISIGNETNIFYTSERDDTSYYYGDFFTDEKNGDLLSMLSLTKGQDSISKKVLFENSGFNIYNYEAVSPYTVVVNTRNDLWISNVDKDKPTPYQLSSMGLGFSSYVFINNKAFRILTGQKPSDNSLIMCTDQPSQGKKVEGTKDLWSIHWGIAIGNYAIIGENSNLIVLDVKSDLLIKEIPFEVSTFSYDLKKQVVSKDAAVLHNNENICLFTATGDPIDVFCAENSKLDLRGSLEGIHQLENENIELYSIIKELNDIERVVIKVDKENKTLLVVSREKISSYEPKTEVLVPVKSR